LHESPSLITIPLIVLAILATIGGMISLKQLVESLFDSNFTKLATAEHHLGTTEYLDGYCCCGWISRNWYTYAKYIKQNTVPSEDAANTGFSKVLYNKYLMNFMMLFC
jgi:NADH-quinone oxidoreductase subunit L